jgi:hypothetical protein
LTVVIPRFIGGSASFGNLRALMVRVSEESMFLSLTRDLGSVLCMRHRFVQAPVQHAGLGQVRFPGRDGNTVLVLAHRLLEQGERLRTSAGDRQGSAEQRHARSDPYRDVGRPARREPLLEHGDREDGLPVDASARAAASPASVMARSNSPSSHSDHTSHARL